MLRKMYTSFLLACLTAGVTAQATMPEALVLAAKSRSAFNQRCVAFTNDLGELSALFDYDDDQRAAIAHALNNAKLTVNGRTIEPGKTVVIPIINNAYTITLEFDAASAAVMFNKAGILKYVRYMCISALTRPFKVHMTMHEMLDESDTTVDLRLAVIDRIEEWAQKAPPLGVSFRSPLAPVLRVNHKK